VAGDYPLRFELNRVPDLVAISEQYPEHYPFLLDSTAQGVLGRHSLLLRRSGPVLRQEADGTLTGPGEEGQTFLERLRDWYLRESVDGRLVDLPPGLGGLPFLGGWFLYLGYELAGEIEPRLRLPAAMGLPRALAARCDGAVIISHGEPGGSGGACDQPRACLLAENPQALARLRREVEGTASAWLLPPDSERSREPPLEALSADDPSRFESALGTIHEYLLAGDVFQVNLSRSWRGRLRPEVQPLALYRRLQRANPAPFAGFLRDGKLTLLSSSPERLVETRGRRVQTRPIAGTHPRHPDPRRDRSLRQRMLANPKERAEHIMLIDLERNDLGRVCEPGSVRVDELMAVESYAHVHHIVSNVSGRLRAGITPVDAIRAVFPGGTITGCPKVRCMEIIAELEGEGRGAYTGSMGYLDRYGNMDLNILIRSMQIDGRSCVFRTGAGIVADSEARRELDETVHKARGLLAALDADSLFEEAL
jgi:anthranilate synthase component 1